MAKILLIGKALFFTLLCLCALNCRAQDTATEIFDSNFKTLQIAINGNYLTPPMLNMQAGDAMTVEFDEIAEDRRYLRYCVQHCNADWTASSLVESEYLDGFNMADITDYDFSQATMVHYVHYRLSFPA